MIKTIEKNVVANFLGRFCSVISNFIFIPIYIDLLGFKNFSIISFTLVIAGLLSILDFGFTYTLSREFARSDIRHKEKIQIFTTIESIYFILLGFSTFFIYWLSPYIASHYLKVENFDSEYLVFILKIITFDICFQLILKFYVGGLLGLEKQIKANFWLAIFGLVRNGFVIGVIYLYPRLDVFFIWQAAVSIMFALLIRTDLCKTLTGKNIYFSFEVDILILKHVWPFVYGMLLISIVAGLNTQLDKLIISKNLEIESLGFYTVAVSISMGLLSIVNPFCIALFPRLTSLFSLGKNSEASSLFVKINSIVALLVFSMMASMICFPKELIWIWTGNLDVAEGGYKVLPIISISYGMLAMATIPFNIAIAKGYTKLNNQLGIFSLIITVPGYWIIIELFGIIGVSTLFCVVQTFTTLFYLYFINKKFIHVDKIYTLFVKTFILTPLICFLIVLTYSFMFEGLLDNRLYSFARIFLASTTAFFVGLFLLTPAEGIRLFQFIFKR